MDKKDIDKHLDGALALLIADRADSGDPEPMSTDEIAKACGVSRGTIIDIELRALKKLKLNPTAWEAATMSMRRSS